MSRGRSDAPVAEEVERKDPVPALGELARERAVHLLRQEQAVDEHARARPLAIARVGQAVP